uniref:Muscleblind-like splicing regulator 2 n=1 Tax=Erpetoichthys calabaricus TaxID=27687 RepID=A0A8C4SQF3_ERPCA
MALNITSIRDTKWLTLEVCRQFQRGTCSRSDEECKFAHPPKSCQVENGRVIACFDSLKSREQCYFHCRPGLCIFINLLFYLLLYIPASQAFPSSVLQPLPKRPALEKSNGASTIFNPSVLHYQQALANAQLQQPTAFIPTVPMMYSATPATVSAATTPATSVPYAATAPANQVCPF